MLRVACVLLTLVSSTLAQTNIAQPPKEPPKSPQRIRVGTPLAVRLDEQDAYWGPAGLWGAHRRLWPEQVTDYEAKLKVNPDDICARGQLIAGFGTLSSPFRRFDHIIWMIQNNPEWDGFLLEPISALTRPRSYAERVAFYRVTDAWRRHISPEQRNATILHNAAVFFAVLEPNTAETLLERARSLEPNVPIHVERLGMVYGYSHLREKWRTELAIGDTPERRSFAKRALEVVSSTTNPMICEGAIRAGALAGALKVTDELIAACERPANGRTRTLERPSNSYKYYRTSCDETPEALGRIFAAGNAVPPPPPPPKEAPKAPAPPQRIRVGGSPASARRDPAMFWRASQNPSSSQWIGLLESLKRNPNDICTRGRLIRDRPPAGFKSLRLENLLWMIRNYPEWDAFWIEPAESLFRPRTDEERSYFEAFREAWIEKVGPKFVSGTILHHAALFFAVRDPRLAAELLERAIDQEPTNRIHAERLGMVYGCALLKPECLQRLGVEDTPERRAFAAQAEQELFESGDLLVLLNAGLHEKCVDPSIASRGSSRANTLVRTQYVPFSRPSQYGGYMFTTCDGDFFYRKN